MIKEPKQEWMALCRTCTWSGKRSQDQITAQQEVDNHLKKHSQHLVRVLVTGVDRSKTPVPVQDNVQDAWKMIAKRQE